MYELRLTRVNFLVNAIKYKDPVLNSDIAMVNGNKVPTRKMNKFKDLAAYLIPWYPCTNNCNTNKKVGSAEIYNTSSRGEEFSATGANQLRCSTGVELCYYKYDEFKTLSKEERDELIEWREYQYSYGKVKKHGQGGFNNSSKNGNIAMKKMISAAVDSTLSQLAESYNQYDVKEKNKTAQSSSPNANKRVRLKSVLNKAK